MSKGTRVGEHTIFRYQVARKDEAGVFVPAVDADGDGLSRASTNDDRAREAAIAAALVCADADPAGHFIVTDTAGDLVQEFAPALVPCPF